jgi:hypothetical protein
VNGKQEEYTMKRFAGYTLGVIAAFGISTAAWAQQDLEVTMDVVPADAAADAATGKIKLPDVAAPEAHENAAFGIDTANKARERREDLNRDFGQEVSEAARERAQERIPSIPNFGQP